jgi:hypothetical protein
MSHINELHNTKSKTVNMLNHKLGLSFSITLDWDKTILNIRDNK